MQHVIELQLSAILQQHMISLSHQEQALRNGVQRPHFRKQGRMHIAWFSIYQESSDGVAIESASLPVQEHTSQHPLAHGSLSSATHLATIHAPVKETSHHARERVLSPPSPTAGTGLPARTKVGCAPAFLGTLLFPCASNHIICHTTILHLRPSVANGPALVHVCLEGACRGLRPLGFRARTGSSLGF